MATVLKDLRKAPWTLWAYVVLNVVLLPVGLLTASGRVHWPFLVLGVPFTLALFFFLLRGSRVVWWLLVLGAAGGLVISITTAEPWYRFPGPVVGLGLLLAPPSRRYVFPPKPSLPKDAGTWDPTAHDDPTRPPGWYFDPADATRMRYWDPELGGWQSKATRAPRHLRRLSRQAESD